MTSGPTKKPSSLDDVYAEAYRSYLRSLKEGLANLDIDALDLSDVRAPVHFSVGASNPNAVFTLAGFTLGNVPDAAGFTLGQAAGGGTFTLGGASAAGGTSDASGTTAPPPDDKSA